MFLRNASIFLLVLFLLILVGGKIYAIKGHHVDSLPEGYSFGMNKGRLAPCRDKPNCVCTDHENGHYMKPFPLSGDSIDVFSQAYQVLEGCQLVESRDNYQRLECRTSFFGFIDDVELFHDTDHDLLRFRSAARLGYSDLGVNRKRMESLLRWLENRP